MKGFEVRGRVVDRISGISSGFGWDPDSDVVIDLKLKI
jgi:hypothetical protein